MWGQKGTLIILSTIEINLKIYSVKEQVAIIIIYRGIYRYIHVCIMYYKCIYITHR